MHSATVTGRAWPYFVIEDVERVLLREHRLLDEGASEPGLSLGEQGLDEILFHVQILVEELGEGSLIQIRTDPHHRELEETSHRGRQAIDRVPVLSLSANRA
jgi:hypothetical protein